MMYSASQTDLKNIIQWLGVRNESQWEDQTSLLSQTISEYPPPVRCEILPRSNQQGEFKEWHHGEAGLAHGVREQARSAGMYLFAFRVDVIPFWRWY